jgi:hypothetical protein
MKEDKEFEALAANSCDRRRFSNKVLIAVTSFAGSTDLAFRNAACDAIFKLVSGVMDLRTSIPRETRRAVRASNLLDRCRNVPIENATFASQHLRTFAW